jgi:acyl carrier protein
VHQDDIKTAFVEILEEVANVNRTAVTGDRRLREDLGIDSLSLIDVAIAAEDTFGIRKKVSRRLVMRSVTSGTPA